MTIRACRKAVFGLSLTTIFLLFCIPELSVALTCTDIRSYYPTFEKLETCTDSKMSPTGFDNKTYPISDFSSYTQDMMTKILEVKPQSNQPRLFSGNFLVRKSSLTSIAIGMYVRYEEFSQSFVVEDNWNLAELEVLTPNKPLDGASENFKVLITIKNNKLLSKDSIEKLHKIDYQLKGSYIQKYGECDFKGVAIKSIQDLEYCQYTIGDIIIDSNTAVEKYSPEKMVLKKIGACLNIQNKNIENLDFLPEKIETKGCANHEISVSKKLCIHPEQLQKLNKTFNDRLTFKNDNNCEGVCTFVYFMNTKERACVILDGNVKIDSSFNDVSLFDKIKKINGRLIIQNTNFTYVDFFPNLVTINDSASDKLGNSEDKTYGTIEIMYNTLLENVSFPKLDEIIVNKNENIKKIYIKENGDKHLPESVRLYFENKFGEDAVTISAPKPPPPPGRSAQQIEEEEEEERNKKATERWSDTTKTVVIVLAVVFGVLIVAGIFGGLIFLGCRRRKEYIKNQSKYCLIGATPLDIPRFITIKYNKPLPWIEEAQAVISANVNKISEQEKEIEGRRFEDYEVLPHKNSAVKAPIWSRNDNILPNIENHRHFIPKVEGECNKECELHKKKGIKKEHGCRTPCKCTDHGVKCNNGYAFGIRMEKKYNEWNPNEMERIHYILAKKFKLPVTYEETSSSTMTRMMKISQSIIDDEIAWQTEHDCFSKMCISSRKIIGNKKSKEKKDKNTKKENAEKRCSTLYYTVSHTTFEGKELDKFKCLPVNEKNPCFLRHIFKCSCCCKGDKNYFYDTMIYVHMNCPPGKWVSDYAAKHFITLCNNTVDAIKSTSKGTMHVSMESVNVRIIGQLMGDFENLRVGLCHPSVNGNDEEHPICNVKHIFLGNLVGPNGPNMHVLCLLFALKCRYPENYILLRGAMEWDEMSDISGLKKEVVMRFPDNPIGVYDAIMDVFSNLPFTCKVGDTLLCSNAGVAPRMAEVVSTKLPIKELVPDTLAFNLVFAQPNYTVKRFFDNVEQGAGYYFGDEAMNHAVENLECMALICTKNLVTGYGIFGYVDRRMYTINGTNSHGGLIAQVEFDERGLMHIQIITV